MKVKEIMEREVVYAEVPGKSEEALSLLLKHNLTTLPVVKEKTKKVVGMVSRSDFASKPGEEQLALLMTKNVITAKEDDDVKDVVKSILVSGVKRLPVVDDDGNLRGIITSEDIVWKAITKLNIESQVSNYMLKYFISLWEETPLNVTAEIMRLANTKIAIVLNSDAKLSGIISDADMLKAATLEEKTEKSETGAGGEGEAWGWESKSFVYITKKSLEIPNIKVKDVATKSVVTVTKSTTVSECAAKMAKNRIEIIPVIEGEGRIIGVVRDIDLLRVLKNK